MDFFNWLGRLIHGLPLYDSEELIAAKRYKSYSCYCDCEEEKKVDLNLLTSEELEEKAMQVYKYYGQNNYSERICKSVF